MGWFKDALGFATLGAFYDGGDSPGLDLSGKYGLQPGQGESIEELTNYDDIEGIFEGLISQASAGGGILSPVQGQRAFGMASTGAMRQLETRLRDMRRALQRGGYTSGRSKAMLRDEGFGTMRELLGQRVGAQQQLETSRFGAQQGLANAKAGATMASKQDRLAAILNQRSINAGLQASINQADAYKDAALMSTIGSVIGIIPGL